MIEDQAGDEVARIQLTEFDGRANQTGAFAVKAPTREGACTWLVVCPAAMKDGASYAEASAPVSFTVKAHTTSVVAWGTPPAVVIGQRFRTKVGIKCSNECDLTNRAFGIYDGDGARVAEGTLRGDRWPDTTGLYVEEVELDAPAAEGLYTWSVRSPASDTGIPHAEGSIAFGVNVVRHPQHRVTVEAVDRDSQTPLEGARVVMHPYRAVTDARGTAEIWVAKGAYTLFVSQSGYRTLGTPVEVSADMTARAELDLEPVPERH